MKKQMKITKSNKAITLIALIITIIVLLILAGIATSFITGENGILNKAEVAEESSNKEAATESMNLKITTAQMNVYSKEQRMPTLQEFADELCKDGEVQYVELSSKRSIAATKPIDVGKNTSIFVKLNNYRYEFEINDRLQLASIDGVKLATNNTITLTKEELEKYAEDKVKESLETKQIPTDNIVYNTEYVNDKSQSTYVNIYRSGNIIFLYYKLDLKKSIPSSSTILFSGVPKPINAILGWNATENGSHGQIYNLRTYLDRNSNVSLAWTGRATSWSSDDGCQIWGSYTYLTEE